LLTTITLNNLLVAFPKCSTLASRSRQLIHSVGARHLVRTDSWKSATRTAKKVPMAATAFQSMETAII
jgi:uncharacterized protein (DUF1330 family)